MDRKLYTVGWIAPLPLEQIAARSALDQEHGLVPSGGYIYIGGMIGSHNVVIGVQSKMGTDAASDLASRMRDAFPSIEYFFVVGIGGGVPRYGPAGARYEMVLGDVVVSYPRGDYGGVVRSDFGTWEGKDDPRLNIRNHLNGPPDALLAAVNTLRTIHATNDGSNIPNFLSQMRQKIVDQQRNEFEDQGPDRDRLFRDDFSHPDECQNVDCWQCCDFKFSLRRQERGNSATRLIDSPKIHYGNIASSNQLQISAAKRNALQMQYDVICFEMEGAGVIQRHPCLIVRGICDYSDSHKNKAWQAYAAATAAAYTKELLGLLPPKESAQKSVQKSKHEKTDDEQGLKSNTHNRF
jgi:nucleoside phosphorylase